jgi:hypothetical protein
MMIVGCDKKPEDIVNSMSQTVNSMSQTVIPKNNQWVYSEKVDKMTDIKELFVETSLIDEQTPNVKVITKLSCDGKYFKITLTTFSIDGINNITFKDNSYIAGVTNVKFRSGDNKYDETFIRIDYSNQMIKTFKTYPPENVLGNDRKSDFEKFVSNTSYPNGTLLFQVSTSQGDPVLTINLDNDNVRKIFNSCLPK